MNKQFYPYILYFYTGIIIKLTFHFFAIFIKKKNYFLILNTIIKFSSVINRRLLFSSIGIFFFEVLKNKFGSKIIMCQLIKKTFKKKLCFFMLFNQNLFELTHFKHSGQILDFFFQIFINNKQKIFQIISLALFGNLLKRVTFYKLYNKIYTLRIFFSGFSVKKKKKLKSIFTNRLNTLNKLLNRHSPFFFFFFFSEFIRFTKINYHVLFDIFLKKIQFGSCERIEFFTNLIDFSNINILCKILKKINFSLPNILKYKNGYLLILKIVPLNSFESQRIRFLKTCFSSQFRNLIGFYHVLLIFLNSNFKLFYSKKYFLSQKDKIVSIFLDTKFKIHLYDILGKFLNQLLSYTPETFSIIESFCQKISFSRKFKKNTFHVIFKKKNIYLTYLLNYKIINFSFIQFMSSIKKIGSFFSKIYLFFFSFIYTFLHKKINFFKKSILKNFFLSFAFDKRVKINYKFFFVAVFIPVKSQFAYLLNISYSDWITK